VPAPGTDPGVDSQPDGGAPSTGVPAKAATDGGMLFPNLTLQGLRSAADMAAPVAVSTWDYYDPDGLQYDLLHVMAIFLWCPHCNNETTDLSTIAAWQAEHRVAVLQIALQGYSSSSPTWAEIQKWASDHNVAFPVVIDGQGAQLSQSFKFDGVPFNIVVNPRTMEVMETDVGEVGSVQAYEQKFLN